MCGEYAMLIRFVSTPDAAAMPPRRQLMIFARCRHVAAAADAIYGFHYDADVAICRRWRLMPYLLSFSAIVTPLRH